MRAHVRITLAYLVLCHILLYSTSPSYKHELKRLATVALDGLHRLSFGYLGIEHSPSWRMQPRSGLYRSTDLLESVQSSMAFNASTGLYVANGLVAYMSATDAIQGQGWKARATLFVQLMAPRYTLLPFVHRSLQPQLKLLRLAAADLPAVGRLAGSEDLSIGYRLSCRSPAMHFSLGPQPIANCSVWPAADPAGPTTAGAATGAVAASKHAAAAAASSASEGVAVNACNVCPAGVALYTAMRNARCMCCPSLAPGSSSFQPQGKRAAAAAVSATAAQPLAFWTIVPTSFDEVPATAAAAADKQSDGQQQQLPLLGGPSYYEPPPGGLLSLMAACDAWFIFPRTPLVRLLPAMTGLQQLVFGYAVASYTFLDLLHIITAMQQLHTSMRIRDPFMAGSWSIGAAACSVAGQLLVLLVCRLVVSTVLAFLAVAALHHALRVVRWSALLLQLPTIKGVAVMLRLRSSLAGATAAGSAAAAGSQAAVAGGGAAAAASTEAGAVAAAAMRGSGMLRGLGGSVSAVAARAASGLGVDAAGTAAAKGAVRGWLLPWYLQIWAVHYFCEDLLLLTCARLVWELQELTFDMVWTFLGFLAWQAQALLESSAAMVGLLLHGASWRAAWARFNQLQQVQQQRRANAVAAGGAGGAENRVQAQVFIQAPADMGQAAEALRSLADELEQLGMHPLGLVAGRGGQRARGVQVLGQHWPAPLNLPFEAEDVQSELGVEVPRGFICPITQDIMKLPALLISSTVAVPATYDRDAIARWLEDSRRDPKSRQTLAADAQLVPNMDLYRAIEDWAAEKQAQRNQRAAAVQHATAPPAAEQHDVHQAGAAAADATAAGDAGEQRALPGSSAGAVCSSLLAAVRGAAAAVRHTQSLSRGQDGRHGTAAAAAAGGLDSSDDDDDDGSLPSDDEVEGPAAARPGVAAAAGAAAAAGQHCGGVRRYWQRQRQQQQAPSSPVPAGEPWEARQGQAVEQQEEASAAGEDGHNGAAVGRYNLRRNRGSTPGR